MPNLSSLAGLEVAGLIRLGLLGHLNQFGQERFCSRSGRGHAHEVRLISFGMVKYS